MARSKQTLVFGRASRLAWHLALLALGWYSFAWAVTLMASLELHAYLCFAVSGILCGYGVYAIADNVAKDDRLADGISRDMFVIWLCKSALRGPTPPTAAPPPSAAYLQVAQRHPWQRTPRPTYAPTPPPPPPPHTHSM